MQIGRYVLMQKTVTLRGGKKLTVRFFAAEDPSDPAYVVQEQPREATTGEEVLAWALVKVMNYNRFEAAALAARMKASLERLPEEEMQAVEQRLLDVLLQGN